MSTSRSRWAALAAAALLPLSATACGDDDTAGPETGTDVQDITEEDQYFADGDEFVGETVTVSAEVSEVLGSKSFVVNGDDWGDDSLLVLSAEEATSLQEDDVVRVTGTVREFTYDTYANDYGLVDPGLYEVYGTEKFIEASAVDQTTTGATTTG